MPSLLYRAARYGYFTAQERLRPLLGEGFELDGRHYRYFYSHRGMTWRSERIVEVPLALEFLARHRGKRVLEVGNVMRQYGETGHTVVDKYERAPGVINEDAATFTAAPFDAILSISTLEHVGWDEPQREPGKVWRVIERLRGELLAPGGSLLVTTPWGWNRELDTLLAGGDLPFDRTSYLRRHDFLNRRWTQVAGTADLDGARYGYPFVGAAAVAVSRIGAG